MPLPYKINTITVMKLNTIICLLLTGTVYTACNQQSGSGAQVDSTNLSIPDSNAADHTRYGNNTADTLAGKLPDKQTEDFIDEASGGGQMEVALGNLAVKRASNERVRRFGQMMVDDHSEANSELTDIAKQLRVSVTGIGSGQKKYMEDLSKMRGADFDRAYMRLMETDHKKDIQEFEDASREDVDQQVARFIQNTLPVLKKHLDSAQAINKALK